MTSTAMLPPALEPVRVYLVRASELQRASQLGESKMKEQDKDPTLASSKKKIALTRSWDNFAKTSERFERQRLSCDAGLAFVFSEGVLVDAIQNGKWYVVL